MESYFLKARAAGILNKKNRLATGLQLKVYQKN